MRKTFFMVALALSLPLIAQARGRVNKVIPAGKAFKAETQVKDKSLARLCGMTCAQQIQAMRTSLGPKVKGLIDSLKSLSLSSEGAKVVATSVAAIPAVHMNMSRHNRSEADSTTSAIMNAGVQSRNWDADTQGVVEKFTRLVATQGVDVAVKKVFPGTSTANKLQEIKENCRL